MPFSFFVQAIQEEGGNPDEIILTPDSLPKKANVTPKRTTRGKICIKVFTMLSNIQP